MASPVCSFLSFFFSCYSPEIVSPSRRAKTKDRWGAPPVNVAALEFFIGIFYGPLGKRLKTALAVPDVCARPRCRRHRFTAKRKCANKYTFTHKEFRRFPRVSEHSAPFMIHRGALLRKKKKQICCVLAGFENCEEVFFFFLIRSVRGTLPGTMATFRRRAHKKATEDVVEVVKRHSGLIPVICRIRPWPSGRHHGRRQ